MHAEKKMKHKRRRKCSSFHSIFVVRLWYNMYVREGLTIKNKDYLVIKYRLNSITSTSEQTNTKYKNKSHKELVETH